MDIFYGWMEIYFGWVRVGGCILWVIRGGWIYFYRWIGLSGGMFGLAGLGGYFL